MKYVKTLGLGLMATMALMASAGADTASASVLCTTATNPCTSPYANGTTIEASLESGTTSTFRNTESTIIDTCTNSRVSGSLTNGSSTATARVAVTTTGLTFSACTNEPTTTVTGGEVEIHAIDDNGNGTVTAKGITVTMPFSGISCAFTAGSGVDLGTYTESSKTININAVLGRDSNHSQSILCPGTWVWEAKYVITKPTGTVFIATS